MLKFIRFVILLICIGNIYANNTNNPLVVNATITDSTIIFNPSVIPENTPFVIHIINQAHTPIELENSDTSVEIYTGTDKTFKVGLPAGKYKFFNDFNSKTIPTYLNVLSPTQMANPNVASSDTLDNQTKVSSDNTSLGEITFIMWRESIEALLVVGIIYGWLKHLKTKRKEGMIFLAAGIGVGVLCAISLGIVLIKLSGSVSEGAQEYLQAGLTLLAAFMIVYMVKWMRTNGSKLKSEMLNTIAAKHEVRRWNLSVLIVVAIAIAREGSEAVIFIYALGFGEHGVITSGMIGSVALGLGLAILTIWLLSLGNKIFSWKYFFKITEVLLLLLGGALILNCVDLLVSVGVLPVIKAKFWDTSFILGDGGSFVPLLTSTIGYRATPSLIDILVYICYWVIALKIIKIKSPLK